MTEAPSQHPDASRPTDSGADAGDALAWFRPWMVLTVGLALWTTTMLVLSAHRPILYDAITEEDRIVEWWTTFLFGLGALLHVLRARRLGSPLPYLVAAFCVLAAGEEISWGQRLIGFTPPEVFLAENYQQEFTIHNFADVLGRPKWMLIICLAGYGLVLPILARTLGGRAERPGWLARSARILAPPLGLLPWFVAAILLLVWYPIDMTAEWTEAIAGSLFMAAALPSGVAATIASVLMLLPAWAMTALGDDRRAHPDALACAQAEVTALRDAIASGAAQPRRMLRSRSVHRRVWTLTQSGQIEAEAAALLANVQCSDVTGDPSARRRYAVDPWGTAYWIRTRRPRAGVRFVTVYSFGPNRRRDERGPSDDIVADTLLSSRQRDRSSDDAPSSDTLGAPDDSPSPADTAREGEKAR